MEEVDDITGGIEDEGSVEPIDQRIHERFRVSFKVLIRLSNGEVAHARAVDLSMGGIYIEYGSPADAGVEFDMAFNLSFADEFKRVMVRAKVVRTVVIGSRDLFGMAFVFTELVGESQEILSKYLKLRGLQTG